MAITGGQKAEEYTKVNRNYIFRMPTFCFISWKNCLIALYVTTLNLQ
jgi:hypothetical protein